MTFPRTCLAALGALLALRAMAAGVSVVDDRGHTVTLPAPARRVVSLAPHVTELVFAAGGGQRLVGVVEYSDHPPEARAIRRIGDSQSLDLEAIAALKPDLFVVWPHGNARQQLARLQALNVPVYQSEPSRLTDIPSALERLGRLMGTADAARAEGRRFTERLATLRQHYGGRPPVRTFYQVWARPLMTINDGHMISEVIRLCGGVNVFGALRPLVPTLSEEAVLQADPEFMFTATAGATAADRPLDGLDGWRRFPRLTAVARGNLFSLNGDLISRPTPRILDGAAEVCEAMEAARRRR
jgi:iron complex transport system substrate-binding protein